MLSKSLNQVNELVRPKLACVASVSSKQKAIFRFLAAREIGRAQKKKKKKRKKKELPISHPARNRKIAFRSLETLATQASPKSPRISVVRASDQCMERHSVCVVVPRSGYVMINTRRLQQLRTV